MNPSALIDSESRQLLLEAAKNGKVEVLKELREKHNLGSEDALADGGQVIWAAIQHGHSDVLRELRNGYGVLPHDLLKNGNLAICEAVKRGHCNVLEELKENFVFTHRAVVGNNIGRFGKAVRWAVREGHGSVIQTLRKCFLIDHQILRKTGAGFVALECADTAEKIGVLYELRDTFRHSDFFHLRNALHKAMQNGNFGMVQALQSMLELNMQSIRASGGDALIEIIQKSDLWVLKELCASHSFALSDALAAMDAARRDIEACMSLFETLRECFSSAAEETALRQKLLKIIILTNSFEALCEARVKHGVGADDFRANGNEMLRLATKRCSAFFFREMHNCGVRGSDICLDDVLEFVVEQRESASTLKVLHERYGVDIRNNRGAFLLAAARSGRIDVLRAIGSICQADMSSEIRANDYKIFIEAVRCGHVSFLRELRMNFGLNANDARACNQQALRMAAENGRANVLEELRESFGLDADDVRECIDALLEIIDKNSDEANKKLFRALYLNFGITFAEIHECARKKYLA